ncbi:MAG TPA: c-type cytochrome [Steroidobacteraceae bacterium]|nr:c-type cytochrome [Steroidobacteraceae bacterium]
MKATTRLGFSAVAVAAATLAIGANTLARGESSPLRLTADPVHGKAVYQACMACHSLDEDDVGPKHRGVVGRVAAAVPGYAYSPALKRSGLTWDATTLDRWLANPQALVPGTKMFFALPDPKDRADVIAYLAEQY